MTNPVSQTIANSVVLDFEGLTLNTPTTINGALEVDTISLSGSTSGEVTLSVPATVSSYPIVFPAEQGSNGEILINDGEGNFYWGPTGTGITGSIIVAQGTQQINSNIIEIGSGLELSPQTSGPPIIVQSATFTSGDMQLQDSVTIGNYLLAAVIGNNGYGSTFCDLPLLFSVGSYPHNLVLFGGIATSQIPAVQNATDIVFLAEVEFFSGLSTIEFFETTISQSGTIFSFTTGTFSANNLLVHLATSNGNFNGPITNLEPAGSILQIQHGSYDGTSVGGFIASCENIPAEGAVVSWSDPNDGFTNGLAIVFNGTSLDVSKIVLQPPNVVINGTTQNAIISQFNFTSTLSSVSFSNGTLTVNLP